MDPLLICFADERIESDYQIYHAVESRAAQLILIEALTTGRVFAFLWSIFSAIIYSFDSDVVIISALHALLPRIYRRVLVSQYWKPWYLHILLCAVSYVYGLRIVRVETFHMTLAAYGTLRIISVAGLAGSWLTQAAFQIMDFTFICGVAINYGHSAEVFDASGGLLVIVALTACATRMMERTRREKWWTQCLLDEELKRQLQRSVDSEKMVRFLSHEVRNPQNAITLAVEGLLNDAKDNTQLYDAEQLRVFQIIHSSSEFVTSLLEDVLNCQRLCDNKMTIELAPFGLTAFVQQVCQSLDPLLLKKQLSLSTNIDSHLPARVLGDKHRLRQVLTNLVSNSSKFTPKNGKITVAVALDQTPPALKPCIQGETIGHTDDVPVVSWVRFSVRDTGVGIALADQEKLFRSFSQIKSGELQQGGGMGLGLNICKGLVELHGGEIGVTSTLGHGAEFFFTIPFSLPLSIDTSTDSTAVKLVMSPQLEPATPLRAATTTEVITQLYSYVSAKHQPALPNGVTKAVSWVSSENGRSLNAVDKIASVGPGKAATSGAVVRSLDTAFHFSSRPSSTIHSAPASRRTSSGRALGLDPLFSVASNVASAISAASFTAATQGGAGLRRRGAVPPLARVPQTHDQDTLSSGSGGCASLVLPSSAVVGSSMSLGSPLVIMNGFRVLIAEDSEFIQLLMGRLLHRLGFEFDSAANGQIALQRLSRADHGFDILLCDMMMPVMDGLEAVRTLRDRGNRIPIVGLTGNADDLDTDTFLKAGANVVLIKPVTGDLLKSTLLNILQR